MAQGLRLWWFGFEGESGLGVRSPSISAGRYWMRLSRFFDDGGQRLRPGCCKLPRLRALFHVRPGALGRVEVGGVRRSLGDGQPVRVHAGEGAHHGARWVFRLSQIKMTGALGWVVAGGRPGLRSLLRTCCGARLCRQRGGCGSGRRTRLRLPGLRQTRRAAEEPRRSLSRIPRPRECCPRRPRVRAFGGRRACPASSSKQMYAPVAAASLEA